MKAPSDLRPRGRGRRFWAKATEGFAFTDAELEILAESCRTMDECDDLRAAILADGVTAQGSRGQPRVHPALTELRQARETLRRLLGSLELPDEDDAAPTPRSEKAARAARARWDRG